MILSLEEIQRPIAADLQIFEVKFRDSMKTKVMLLDKIMTYIVKRKGKQIRPMFVFLSAHLTGGMTEATFRGAALIELVHTASLVHDDVVDDASMRRGFFSINALWKNKIAVLVGDYLLSKGLLLSCKYKDYNLLEILSDSVREMSEGELLQMEKARRLDITEETYFEIIRQKTASLISSCCGVGAASAGADAGTIEKLKLFGEKVGLAFQIKDDLFDYNTSKVIGKPVGIDIKEKKMTLPLIYALQNCSWLEKRKIINIVKNESHKPAKVSEVIEFVKRSGGIEYATKAMEKYIAEANKILSDFPDSIYKQSLLHLVKFTIERSK
jgi:octaprenyl-diphosphate synthase